MEQDQLERFKDWWLRERVLAPPFESPAMFDGQICGAVLYRAECWQVQLFILKPDSVVPEHRHPSVDSFEVYLAGEIEFTIDGDAMTSLEVERLPAFNGRPVHFGQDIRVAPGTWHGARTGAKGGVFLSIQQWLNGLAPSNVGADWEHRPGETRRNLEAGA